MLTIDTSLACMLFSQLCAPQCNARSMQTVKTSARVSNVNVQAPAQQPVFRCVVPMERLTRMNANYKENHASERNGFM